MGNGAKKKRRRCVSNGAAAKVGFDGGSAATNQRERVHSEFTPVSLVNGAVSVKNGGTVTVTRHFGEQGESR